MPSTTFSIRIDPATLARIDAAATREGITRTQYILNWLPAYHERTTETPPDEDNADQR